LPIGSPTAGAKASVPSTGPVTSRTVVVLDVQFWLPGWTEPAEAAWREKQTSLLAGDDWIADGNYHATLDLRLGRADTVVFIDLPWWICARRLTDQCTGAPNEPYARGLQDRRDGRAGHGAAAMAGVVDNGAAGVLGKPVMARGGGRRTLGLAGAVLRLAQVQFNSDSEDAVQ
jgi:hypothetical protein